MIDSLLEGLFKATLLGARVYDNTVNPKEDESLKRYNLKLVMKNGQEIKIKKVKKSDIDKIKFIQNYAKASGNTRVTIKDTQIDVFHIQSMKVKDVKK